MARVLLDNEQWDFGTSCFVCEPKNERGIGIPFYVDAEQDRVEADITPRLHHSSAPTFAHGGFSMALLDEGMAWAVIALAHRFGVTRTTTVDFKRPVLVDRPHLLLARIESQDGHDLVATAEITDARGRTCVSARGSFYVMTKEEAAVALGQESQQAQSYVREPSASGPATEQVT